MGIGNLTISISYYIFVFLLLLSARKVYPKMSHNFSVNDITYLLNAKITRSFQSVSEQLIICLKIPLLNEMFDHSNSICQSVCYIGKSIVMCKMPFLMKPKI